MSDLRSFIGQQDLPLEKREIIKQIDYKGIIAFVREGTSD